MLCPRCDYDLSGLPTQHTCPECGCNYDEYSIGIALTARRQQLWGLWVALPLFALATWLEVSQSSRGWDNLRHFLVPGAILVGVAFRFVRRGGLPTRMILDRDGVELVTPGQEPLRWPWYDIRRVEVGWMSGAFRLYADKKETLISRNYRALGDLNTARQCAAEINRRIELYNSRPSAPPPPSHHD